MLDGWLGTPPPERGRSTRPSWMFPTWPKIYLPKSATADFDWRSGGGRDPHPIPPLFKGREEIAACSDPNAIVSPYLLRSAAAFPRTAGFELVVGRLRDHAQPVAVRGPAHHVGPVAVHPVERRDLTGVAIAQRGLRRVPARAIEREAFPRRALVHQEPGRSARSGQQPAADEFQPDRGEIGRAQIVTEPFGEPLHQMRSLGTRHFDRMPHFDDVKLVRV